MSNMPTRVLGYATGFAISLVLVSSCTPFNIWRTSLTPTPLSSPGESSAALIRLLINESDLPPNDWKLSILPDKWPEYHGQDDGMYVGFNTDALSVPIVHIVLRYRSDSHAEKGFDRSAQAHFNSAGRLTPWERPAQLDIESEIADRFRLACADFQSIGPKKIDFTYCVAVARYQQYISILSAEIADRFEGTVSYSEFESVLQAINERMRAELDAAEVDPPKNE